MSRCSEVGTPCGREEGSKLGEDEVYIVDQERVARFRRTAAKLNYLAMDDPRIGFASKVISQGMAKPTEEGEVWIKRALRYLKGKPVCEWRFVWRDMPTQLVGSSDSDWAVCPKTRRRTSGGGIMLGAHLLTH